MYGYSMLLIYINRQILIITGDVFATELKNGVAFFFPSKLQLPVLLLIY